MSESDPAKQSDQPTRITSLRRIFPVAFTLIAGVAVTLTAFAVIRGMEHERIQQDFEGFSQTEAHLIDTDIGSYEECLYTLRNLFAASNHVNRDEFRLVCDDLRTRQPGVRMLQWLPRVRDSDRRLVEAEARSEVDPDWVIHQGYPESGLPKHPAEQRDQYLPSLYVEPSGNNEETFGFDEFRGPHQRAVQRAIETGKISATRRILLPNSTGYGWVEYLAIYETGQPASTPEERWDHLQGVLRGTFALSELFRRGDGDLNSALDIVLTDDTPGTTEPYLLNFSRGELRTSPPPTAADFVGKTNTTHSIDSAGRLWTLHSRPNPTWLATKWTGFPYVVLAFGLWLSTLLATSIHSARRRAETVERLVETRTTQLRNVQEQLSEDVRRRREAEDRYRAFVEQSTEAIWRFEFDEPMPVDWPEERQIEYIHRHAFMAECNDVCARMYGFQHSAEMVGKRLHDLMPLLEPRNLEHLREYVRSGFRLVDSESHELDRRGGGRIFLNNIIGLVEDGKLVRSWGTQRDITGQRRMEQERLADAMRLRVAVAASSVGLWEWDFAKDTVHWNDELHAMFGFKPGKFPGTYAAYLECIHPYDRDRVTKAVASAFENPHEFEFEYRIIRPDGAERWIYSRGDVRRNERGRVIGMLGAAIDITSRKKEEEEHSRLEQKLQDAQKLESLGILAGGIAHDFNNLLTGVLGNAALARMDLPASSPVQLNLAQIEQASQRAADLCRQMLAYSGKGRFVIQLVNLSHLVEETCPLLRVSVGKDVALKLRMKNPLPAVTADITQLRQILMNLVINASDAITDRPGVIEITTGVIYADRAYLADTHLAPDLPEGEYVYLEVSDNGCGMTAATLKRIFDPFFTTKFTGRGLGLAAVLGIVRGHQGALKVYSEVNQGTSFKLLLPKSEGVPEILAGRLSKPTSWRGSGRILLIDDEETIRNVATQMLRVLGFEAITATRGPEGLKLFKAEPKAFVAVLLDLTMPQMNGPETFTELRRIRPDVKVILMSGFNQHEAINRFAGKGLAGFLQKPFSPQELSDILQAMVEQGADI